MWKIGIECGQKIYRYRSWFGRSFFFRKLQGCPGFAIGPVMVYREE